MKYSTYKWAYMGDLLISFATAGPVQEDVWDAFIKDIKTKPFNRYLSTAVGFVEVNSVQRKMASDVLKGKSICVAVVTDEKLVRGIVTAASWMGVNIKAFAWEEIKAAIQHLGVGALSEARILEKVAQLRQ